MRVLLLGPWPPPHGGVQTNLVAIRDMLRQRGIPCAVINLHRHRTGRGEDVYHPTNPLQVFRLLLRLRYDVVHLHLGGSVTSRLLALGLACCLMPRTKAVLTFHSGGYASSPEGKAARPRTLRGFVFRRFERIIAVNREIVELFRRFGVPDERIKLISPHALPSEPPMAELPENLRAFFAAHRPVLVSVGLLEPEYDLPLQIEALGRVRERFPEAGLLLIGSGSLEQDLRDRIRAQPWREHVLLCGDLPHPATLRAIADAGVLLRTTLYDGDSVAVREALHLGTPVIATDNGMRPEGVRIIPVSDIGALCRAVEECMSAPRPAKPPGKEDRSNIEAVLAVYKDLYGAPRRAALGAATPFVKL